MAVITIPLEDLQELDKDQYIKKAQTMLTNMSKTKNEKYGFVFIDDYKFDEKDLDGDGDLQSQPVFITGNKHDSVWKPKHITELKNDGYKQDLMYGTCWCDENKKLHLSDLKGGSIMKKNLDLKFLNYLKDVSRPKVFDDWEFDDGKEKTTSGSAKDLFGTEKEKEAVNRERERLLEEIQVESKDFTDAYEKSKDEPGSETLEGFLDASAEIRSDLIDLYKVYLAVYKRATK